MTRQQIHSKIHFFLAMLIAFNLPIAQWVPVFIFLMAVNWIVEADFKNKFNTIFKNKFSVLFIFLYLIHLLGLLYTENMKAGYFDVQVKLSILLFPLFFASRPLSREQVQKVFLALIGGCLITFIAMLVRATSTYIESGENHFFYEAFASFLIHPGYISMYVNVALSWLLFRLLSAKGILPVGIVYFLLVLFTLFIILLSSKLGLLLMILLYIGFLGYYVITRKKYAFGVIGIAVTIVSLYMVMRYLPELSIRIDRAISVMTGSRTERAELESTAVRLHIWKTANGVIAENPLLGVGTGDAKDVLIKEYEKRGMTGAAEHKLNAHNEYYQVFVALGVLGFLVLIANLFFPLKHAFKEKDTVYVLFLLIIILNSLTESIFETQAGVMFYAFFNSVICFQTSKYE